MGRRLQDGQWSHGWLRASEGLTVPRKELEAPWEVIHFWGSTMGRDALVVTGGPPGWGLRGHYLCPLPRRASFPSKV